ncbi:MAG TPA: ubiquinol-cytochrome c reductase iron-sulfur subunit [Candidatus Limnocylindrales bacterium]|nr:ubiquinol-cytochrome c reductase iron-sulfur subunit [Candidatus Limnocylindrales bacterium]
MEAHRRELSRRRFAIAGTQVVGAGVAVMLGVPIVGFLLNPIFRPRSIIEQKVGFIGNIPPDQPTPFKFPFSPQSSWPAPEANYILYVVRSGSGLDQVRVFSNICSHMQCPVRWDPALKLFLCPCHGGLYDLNGVNVGGPPPRPLPQWVHRIDGNGVLYVTNALTEPI